MSISWNTFYLHVSISVFARDAVGKQTKCQACYQSWRLCALHNVQASCPAPTYRCLPSFPLLVPAGFLDKSCGMHLRVRYDAHFIATHGAPPGDRRTHQPKYLPTFLWHLYLSSNILGQLFHNIEPICCCCCGQKSISTTSSTTTYFSPGTRRLRHHTTLAESMIS